MFTFRNANLDDAEEIAEIIIATGDGIVEHLFENLIEGLTPRMILSAAFIQGEGPYHTDNVIRCRHSDKIAGLLFSYPSSEHAVPPLMESMLPAKRLQAVRPVLERSVPDSLYINSIWIEESYRGQGYGEALMVEAFSRCQALGFHKISLFCWNDNERAMRFYARKGFVLHELLPPELVRVKGHKQGGSILSLTLAGDPA